MNLWEYERQREVFSEWDGESDPGHIKPSHQRWHQHLNKQANKQKIEKTCWQRHRGQWARRLASCQRETSWMDIFLIVKIHRIIKILIACCHLIRYKALRKTPCRKRMSKSCLDENGANIDDTGDKNLKGEDGVGVEEDGWEPKGVEVVESGKNNLLVHIESVNKSFRLVQQVKCQKSLYFWWEFEWTDNSVKIERCVKLDWRKSHRCRMLIVLTDSVLLSNWSWRRPSERLGASTSWKKENSLQFKTLRQPPYFSRGVTCLK